jgi:transposase
MGKPAVTIDLTDEERSELESLVRRRQTAQGLARRAEIVLLAADGLQNKEIVARLGKDANTVGKWRRRFAEHGLDGLYDQPRPGTPRKTGDDEIAETVRKTLEETPVDATHWSLRSMAKATGYAPSTIHRIWQAFGLQPHRSETFKLSTDPFLSRRCGISSGSISARPSAPWCCASTKRARSKRLIAPNRCYR